MLRRAKIIATLGPTSSDEATIHALFQAGVDVFRLNCSHASDHSPVVNIIRSLESRFDRHTTIMVDLQGPKWRIGSFGDLKNIHLREEDPFILDLNPSGGDQNRVQLNHPELYSALKKSDELRLDDGKIRLVIESVNHNTITTRVVQGGLLSSRKGVNIPYVNLPIEALTEKDRIDLQYALTAEVDWIALSFVRKADDIEILKSAIQEHSTKKNPKIIAKIEKPQALDEIESIIQACDAIMVARGDLGVELPLEEVPLIQRRLISLCREAGKPVIVATQMLESMLHMPTPTRAEVSDVAHAIYDGADAVMLSGESAVGPYPIEAVQMMDRIISKVETDPLYRKLIHASTPKPDATRNDALTTAARHAADTIPISCVVACTLTGLTPIRTARERPEAIIVALTPNLEIARMLGLVWGVRAIFTNHTENLSDMSQFAVNLCAEKGWAQSGDCIALLSGMPLWKTGGTNILRIEIVK